MTYKILTIIVLNQENQETILNKILTIIVFNQENQETILNYKKYYYQKHMNLKFRFHHLWIKVILKHRKIKKIKIMKISCIVN